MLNLGDSYKPGNKLNQNTRAYVPRESSIRTLHNYQEAEDVFARIMFVVGDNIDHTKTLEVRFGDITSQTTFNDNLDDSSQLAELNLYLRDEDFFHEILGNEDLHLNRKTILEIHVYPFDEVPTGAFNPIYFIDDFDFELNQDASDQNGNTFMLHGVTIVGALEDKVIVEHNTDNLESGTYVPNMIQVKLNETYYSFISQLYTDNVKNPWLKTKNQPHQGRDATRIMSALGAVRYDFPNTALPYVTSTQYEKKSLLDIKKQFMDAVNNAEFRGYIQTKAKINGTKIDIHLTSVPNLVIDYNDNIDDPIYFRFQPNLANLYQHVYVESSTDPKKDSGYDLTDHTHDQRVLNNLPHFIKKPEDTETEQPNDADNVTINSASYARPIVAKVSEIVGQQKIEPSIEVEVQFDTGEYFKDILAGQAITLINYPRNYMNGVYLVKQISAVFYDKYFDFSMDKITKIE